MAGRFVEPKPHAPPAADIEQRPLGETHGGGFQTLAIQLAK